MRAVHIIIVAAALAGCASNKKDVEAAKHSQYDAEFAVIYSSALDATRVLYPNIDDSPGNGMIRTAWHQVQFATDPGADVAGKTVPTGGGTGVSGAGTTTGGSSPAASSAGMSTRMAYKRYYIRFDVSVLGGRPWKVKVVGHASSWDPGAAMPTELTGPARPSWLDPRIDSLKVAIWKQLKQYAVPMKEETKADVEKPTDPATFKDVPTGAARVLAQTKDALAHRDIAALRPLVADDVMWSAGGAPGVDTAMAMWQADPDTFDAMAKLVAAGCAKESDTRVTCPTTAPAVGQWQLALEMRGDEWKIVQFMRMEGQ